MTAHLALWNWPDPGEQDVEGKVDTANDPEGLGVARAVIHESENDGEDDAAEVPDATREAADDAIGVGVDVRDEGEVGAVAGLEEDGHEGDEAREGGQVVRVDLADDDEQHARDDAAGVHPGLLEPDAAAEAVVQQVGDDAAQGPGDEVEEAEHGGPVGRLGLAQRREVLEVVGRQDRVDGQLAAEGAGVAQHLHPRLRAEEDLHGLAERGLRDHLALGGLDQLVLGQHGLVLGVGAGAAGALQLALVLVFLVHGAVSSARGGGRLFVDAPRDGYDPVAHDAVGVQVLLDV